MEETHARELWVRHLGVVPYGEALLPCSELLRRRASRVRCRRTRSFSWSTRPSSHSAGQQGTASPRLAEFPRGARRRGVRGRARGDVTFHGPGQLVGYPIIDLKRHKRDLHWYLRQVEESLIRALASLGIDAGRNAPYTGVWTGGATRKIASIGVHARDWVTWHGFALNVTTDLSFFDLSSPAASKPSR